MGPAWCEKKDRQLSLAPCDPGLLHLEDGNVSRYHGPLRFTSQSRDPRVILYVLREFLAKWVDLVALALAQLVQRSSQPRRKVVIEHELHAARRCSNSTAATTPALGSSNCAATSSVDFSA